MKSNDSFIKSIRHLQENTTISEDYENYLLCEKERSRVPGSPRKSEQDRNNISSLKNWGPSQVINLKRKELESKEAKRRKPSEFI